MALLPLYGHTAVRSQLRAAFRAGSLPQSLLLHGPAGVGKERLGLWLGRMILCPTPRADGEACGECQSCRFADRLEHPDLQWFFPLVRPDASSPEKLREKLEEARFSELEARRRDPLHLPDFDKAPAHYLASVQNLLRLASTRPALGRRKVFLVGDAEAMVSQESSPEAANAFLKLLEEPSPDTTLIITSSNPGALLPTIRSRVLPVRLLRLSAEEVTDFLVSQRGMAPPAAALLAARSEGAPGRALRLAPGSGGDSALRKQREKARAWLQAATHARPAARLGVAHATAPAGARGEFSHELDALAHWLRDLMAMVAGAGELVPLADDADFLPALARRVAARPAGPAAAIERVREARELAYGNVNPQLILASLLRGVREELLGAAG